MEADGSRNALIKRLYLSQPHDRLLDHALLQTLGISHQRAASYARNGWLQRMAHGLYCFPEASVTFGMAFEYLSSRIEGLHVGGISALGTVADVGQSQILWGDRRACLPRWFTERYPSRYVHARLFDWSQSSPSTRVCLSDREGVLRSQPERALLEMLYETGCKHPLDVARQCFFNSPTLCPVRSAELLNGCTSIKAIRLFLRFARQARRLDVDALIEGSAAEAGSPCRSIGRVGCASALGRESTQ